MKLAALSLLAVWSLTPSPLAIASSVNTPAVAIVPPAPDWTQDLVIYEIAPKAFTSAVDWFRPGRSRHW